MSNINKLTTSFIKNTNALDKVKNQDKYNIYVLMLDEEEMECLQYAQRLRKHADKPHSSSSVSDDAKSMPELKKRGRKKKVVDDEVFQSEPKTPEELTTSSPAYFLHSSHTALMPYDTSLFYF